MSLDEYMMVGDRVGQEVLCHLRRRLDPNLRTAEVGLKLTAFQLDIDGQQTLHVAAQFNQRVVTNRQVAMNRHTDTRFEMRRVLMLLGHA